MEYKKSYNGFVVWLIFLVFSMIGCAFIPIEDSNLLTLIVDNIMIIEVDMLALVIYKTEKIYWYSGLSYEDAKKASPEQRKKYALAHVQRFSIAVGGYFIYSVAAYILRLPIGIHILAALISIVGAAISTMHIHLEK